MFESETEHLHPSIKKCPKCSEKYEEWYRRRRTVKCLGGKKGLVSHVYRCSNKSCSKHDIAIQPEQEGKIVLKEQSFGLDVIMKVGELRYKEHKTWKQIQEELTTQHSVKISDRTVGHLEENYQALMSIVAKENNKLLCELDALNGLILSIDGIKPDSGDDQLFLVREVQTGNILASKLLNYTTQKAIEEILQSVIDLSLPILGIVSDNQQMLTKAIKTKLPNVPHQICQYHFLKRLGKPLKQEDFKLKKNS